MVEWVFNNKLRIRLRKKTQKQTFNLTLAMLTVEQVDREVIVSPLINQEAPRRDNRFILTMVFSCLN